MSDQDDELQTRIETSQELDNNDLNVRAYQYVFRAVQKETNTLPKNFSNKVITKLIAKQKQESSREWWMFGLGFFLLLIAFIVAIVFSGFKLELGFLKSMGGLLAFGAAFIVALNFLEKRLLHNQ